MAEALEKIITIFQESKTFALLSKKNSEDHKLLSKEALKNALLDKNLKVLSLPERPDFQKKWSSIIPEHNCPIFQQTSIRIPKKQYKVKELTYEENDDFLSLVITSENGELNKGAVIFENVLPKIDAAFCFFDPHESSILEEFKDKIILPPKEKIIFLSSNDITFAEKISKIIKAVAPESYNLTATATLLFASLITETNNFIRPISQEVLRFGSDLLSLGAAKEEIKSVLNEEKTLSFSRLLGRALARTHSDEKLHASWTFVSKDDLKKTENSNLSPSFFYGIIRNLRELIPFQPLSLLFWRDEERVFAMAAADEEQELIPLSAALGIKLQSKYFVTGPYDNFSEAELNFRKALQETNSLKI
jgi:hypothetical protein